jgi:hypothetical protein
MMRRLQFVLLGLMLALAVAFSVPGDGARLHPSASLTPAPDALSLAQNGELSVVAPSGTPIIAGDPLTSTVSVGQLLTNPTPAQTNSIYDRIKGRASFVRQIKAALDWLQANDVEAYQRVDGYVTTITQSPYARRATAQPLYGGGCLVRALAARSMSVPMIAALLFHEASHCYQFATVGVLASKEAEVYAYTEQIAFMERNGFPAEELEYYRRVLSYYAGQSDDGHYISPPNF